MRLRLVVISVFLALWLLTPQMSMRVNRQVCVGPCDIAVVVLVNNDQIDTVDLLLTVDGQYKSGTEFPARDAFRRREYHLDEPGTWNIEAVGLVHNHEVARTAERVEVQ